MGASGAAAGARVRWHGRRHLPLPTPALPGQVRAVGGPTGNPGQPPSQPGFARAPAVCGCQRTRPRRARHDEPRARRSGVGPMLRCQNRRVPALRVLVLHNRYRSDQPSGENVVVDLEIELLREAGVEVVEYQRSSDEIAGYSPRQRVALVDQAVLCKRLRRRGFATHQGAPARRRPPAQPLPAALAGGVASRPPAGRRHGADRPQLPAGVRQGHLLPRRAALPRLRGKVAAAACRRARVLSGLPCAKRGHGHRAGRPPPHMARRRPLHRADARDGRAS